MITHHSTTAQWPGEPAEPIARLIARLASYPLDPTFERYGNFVIPLDDPASYYPVAEPGMVRIWGNFADVSDVFEIDGPADALADLIAAIRANQETPAYVAHKAV